VSTDEQATDISAPLQDEHIRMMVDDSLDTILKVTISTAMSVVLVFGVLLSFGGYPFVDEFGDPWLIALIGASIVLWVMLLAIHSQRRSLNERIDAEIDALRLHERRRAVLDIDEMITGDMDPLAKDIDAEGRARYRTRGQSPKGAAVGGGAETFTPTMPRTAAWGVRAEHRDLEDELTRAEEVVVEADDIRAAEAARKWAAREASDPDLIEAGVDRLGDLVASGHFGGPAGSGDADDDSPPD